MKNFQIFKSGFCEKLKLLLIPIGLLIGGFTMHAWADAQFDNVYIYYSLDGGTTETGYSCNWSYGDFTNYAVVTSELKITQVYYRYRKYNGNVCGTQMVYWDGSNNCYYGYKTDGFVENCWEWGGNYVGSEQRNSSYNFSITTAEKPSGIYEFYYCWQMWGSLATSDGCAHNWYMPDNNINTKYTLHYTINPPAVDEFEVSEANHLSGSGTESDPYILPYDGTLSLSISGKQKHKDGNSSAQYYNTSVSNNWSTTATKSISNVTSYDKQSVTVKMRYRNGSTCYHNTSNNLVGTESTKTIWYKAATWNIVGDMNSWNTHTTPLIHSGGSSYSKSITFAANIDVAFKIIDNAGGKWYTYSTSSSTADLTYTANSGRTYNYNSDGSYGNTILKTAGAGSYTFTWDADGKNLTVTYPTSYTVTFGHGDHGSTVTASGSTSGSITSGKYVAKGEDVEFTETHATGYKLKGWYTAESGESAVGTMSSSDNVLNGIAANANVYAQYEGNDFTVRFNANYPSGAVNNGASMADQAFEYATSQNLTANAFACEGYTFTGWKKDNATSGDDVAAGSDGSTLTTTDGAIVNLYAQWSDDRTYYYKGASANGWSTASDWTRNAVPGAGDDVIALTPLQTPAGTTTVNSVRIATSGTYIPVGGVGIPANGSLTIPGGSALKVATSIANCTISENAPTSGTSTTSSTLNIGSGGALAWGTSGTPGDATVGFYTVSGGVPGSQDAINDYIGIPFISLSSDAYSNAWVFAVSGGAWTEISGATLSPWTGYNIIEKKEKGESAGGSYSLSGTLVANNATVSGGATAGTETLYANSWVAPIKISEMDFTGTATVYLFNPASFNQIISAGDPLGNYTAFPKNASGGAYIPSMKSFSVVSSTVSINYMNAVYGEVSGAFSAPRRERGYDYRQAIWDTQDSLFVNVTCASGWGDELKMFIHEDFSQEYENGWDGPKMEGMWEAPKLYALNNEGEMAVACVPDVDNTVIGFHAGTAANEYTMTLKYSGEDELYLRDTKTGVETLLTAETKYEFTSEPNDSDMRFVIRKAQKTTTGIDESKVNANVQKFMHNGTLYIVRDGKIFSVEGTLVK